MHTLFKGTFIKAWIQLCLDWTLHFSVFLSQEVLALRPLKHTGGPLTDSQVSDEEVGDSSECFEAIDDVDDQRVPQDPQNNDGAVGKDQDHLQAERQGH